MDAFLERPALHTQHFRTALEARARTNLERPIAALARETG